MSCLQKKYQYNIKENEPWNFTRIEVPNYDFEKNPFSIECKIINIIINKIDQIDINSISSILYHVVDKNYIKPENKKLFLENILYLLENLCMRLELTNNYVKRIPSLLCCNKTHVYKIHLPLINEIIQDLELHLTVIEEFNV